ncbi:hypothetical protein AXG93_400s1010 [Marchantia polymorpha subsp. ruderalis]|uniref:Uncharacterized protein n=1 Tax=Marchantia polymorpha subsp. ruderalis TaxID=1480154 RepID=A0A176WRJ1_MARPO|nr:hypothetical protein AXG93_400s1010 [Marchantia polymorpha subsp. ruderalis]
MNSTSHEHGKGFRKRKPTPKPTPKPEASHGKGGHGASTQEMRCYGTQAADDGKALPPPHDPNRRRGEGLGGEAPRLTWVESRGDPKLACRTAMLLAPGKIRDRVMWPLTCDNLISPAPVAAPLRLSPSASETRARLLVPHLTSQSTSVAPIVQIYPIGPLTPHDPRSSKLRQPVPFSTTFDSSSHLLLLLLFFRRRTQIPVAKLRSSEAP